MRRMMIAAAALAISWPTAWAQTSPTAATTTGGAGRAMIVLDASGSMWSAVGRASRWRARRWASC